MNLLSTILMSILSVFMPHISHTMFSPQPVQLSAVEAQNWLRTAINEYKPYLAHTAVANEVDVNYVNQDEGVFETPLHNIASRLKEDLAAHYPANFERLMEVAKLLLAHNANVTIVNEHGMPVLHNLVSFEEPLPEGFETMISKNIIEFAKLLLQRGAQINQPDEFDETPLEYAQLAPLAIVRFLLNNGAKYTVALEKAEEVIHDLDFSEKQRSAASTVAQLLKKYQNLEQQLAQNPDRKTAANILKEAIKQGFTQLVRRTLQTGVIPTEQDLKLAAEQYSQTYEQAYKDIGRMLIQNMGLTTKQSGVAKAGIQTGLDLPLEIIEYIRLFLQ